ncbi:phage major capsid protein [Agrobacterium vitis]
MKTKIADLLAARTKAFSALEVAASDEATTDDVYEAAKKAVTDIDMQIKRLKDAQTLMASTAIPSVGQDDLTKVSATVENDAYVKEKSLLLGGITKMIGRSNGDIYNARKHSEETYGENHPVTKALNVSTGSAGGFLVPPDVMNEVIPLLRAQSVVRAAGPRNIAMPRGTMTLPGQNSAATAFYGSENQPIVGSQPSVGNIVASYKKLTAFVPVSNDMMRYADPAIDAFVRDDLVRVIGLREDLAFLLGDGMQNTPKGFLAFANGWVQKGGGTVGNWLTTAASTLAVNGADPDNSTGGNFITSTANYTLSTVATELGGAVNKLDQANVPDSKRVWFMNPRSFNYLYNVQNSLGVYVYRDELTKGMLFSYPVKKTTQIRTNYWDAAGTNKDLSFVMLVEMTEDIVLDSMQLELAVFREGSYVDPVTGATISAMTNDQTVIRAIAEHDHQMRHDAAVAVIQGVRWAPAIS